MNPNDFANLFAEAETRWQRDQVRQAHMTPEEREEERLRKARQNEEELRRLGLVK